MVKLIGFLDLLEESRAARNLRAMTFNLEAKTKTDAWRGDSSGFKYTLEEFLENTVYPRKPLSRCISYTPTANSLYYEMKCNWDSG